MIWHRNYSGPDPLEHARMERIMSLSCIVCALYGDITPRRLECHHIVRGNKRLGHWYTIPLCVGHHRGVDWTDQAVQISIASGSRAFREAHGYDDLQLWQKLQVVLGLSDALPPTKIFKRKAPQTEADVSQ